MSDKSSEATEQQIRYSVCPNILKQLGDSWVHGLKGLDEIKFPDNCFQFDIRKCTEEVLDSKLYQDNRWVNYPTVDTPRKRSESDICDIFNGIGEAIMERNCLGSALVRRWTTTTRFASSLVCPTRGAHRPGVALMNSQQIDDDSSGWSDIFSVIELDISPDAEEEIKVGQLTSDAIYMFECQPDRRFILGVSLVNSVMSLAVFNRGCLLTSDTFNVHEQPERLVRVVAGFMFASREYLGFSKDMFLTSIDGKCSNEITINSNTYTIERVLHIENGLRGRATVCLKVTRDGRTYVVKTAWIDVSDARREDDILYDIRGVKNVIQLVDHETVMVDNEVDTTNLDYKKIKRKHLTHEQRDLLKYLKVLKQVRVVLSPFGRPLRSFKSIREAFRVFIDITEGAHRLCFQQRTTLTHLRLTAIENISNECILHRDISLHNIMISDEEGEDQEGRGILIDFDCAARGNCAPVVVVSSPHEHLVVISNLNPSSPPRQGTRPFTAIDVLRGTSIHRYYHDLESLFYVMIYLFCSNIAPGGPVRFYLLKSCETVFVPWFDEGDKEKVANHKLKIMSRETFVKSVLACLTPCFNIPVVRTCLIQLRALLFEKDRTEEERHEAVNKGVYEVERRNAEEWNFIHAFKTILRTAYDNSPVAEVAREGSSTPSVDTKIGRAHV